MLGFDPLAEEELAASGGAFEQAFAATLKFVGERSSFISHILTATLKLEGAMKRFGYVLAATLKLSGALPSKTTHVLTATLPFKVLLASTWAKVLTATLTFLVGNAEVFTPLDTFKRAPEKPLSNGAQWTALATEIFAAKAGQILGEAYTPKWLTAEEEEKGYSPNEDLAYWNPVEYTEPTVQAEVHALPNGTITPFTPKPPDLLQLLSCISPGPFNAVKAYALLMEWKAGTNEMKFVIEKREGSRPYAPEPEARRLVESGTVNVSVGDLIRLRVKGGKVIASHKSGTSPIWTVVAEVADASFTKGYVGVGGWGGYDHGSLRNFGVNPLEAEAFPNLLVIKQFLATLKFTGALPSRISRAFEATLKLSGKLPSTTSKVLAATLSFLGKRSMTLLDSFEGRAGKGEKPLSDGGKWTAINGMSAAGSISESGEEFYLSEAAFPEEDGAYWNPTEYANPQVSVSIAKVASVNERSGTLWACLSTPTTVEKSGYRLRTVVTSAETFNFILERMTKSVFTELVKTSNVTIKKGYYVGLRVSNGKVQALVKSEESKPWTVAAEASDSTYTTGYVGVGAKGNDQQCVQKFEAGAEERVNPLTSLKVTHEFLATLKFTGMMRRTVEYLRATLQFTGTLPRNTMHGLTATLKMEGVLARTMTHALTATLKLAGNLSTKITHGLEATLKFTGALSRSMVRALEATLKMTGLLERAILHTLAGTLVFAGTLSRNIVHQLAATLKFTGAMSRFVRVLEATLKFTGTLPRNIRSAYEASLRFATSLLDHTIVPLYATLKFTGHMPRTVEYLRATLQFTGTLPRNVLHQLTATLKMEGALGRTITHALTATLKFTGVLAHNITRTLTATLQFTGVLGRNVAHTLTATLKMTGTLAHNVAHTLTATLPFSGTLQRTTAHGLEATLKFTGALARSVSRALTATLQFTGSLSRTVTHGLEATLKFAGSMVPKVPVIIQVLQATLTFAGELPRTVTTAYGATLKFAASTGRNITATLAASLAFTGVLGRSIVHGLEGALSAAGALPRGILKGLAGTLAFSGRTGRLIRHGLQATLKFVGYIPRVFRQVLTATLKFTGSLKPRITEKFVQVLEATLKMTGTVPRNIRHQVQALLTFPTPRMIYTRLTRFFFGPDKLIRKINAADLTLTGHQARTIHLPNDQATLVETRNEVVLLERDLANE